MKPIYEPRGKAKEYGDYALNIYTGCPHGCFYCFAPNVLRKDRDEFHSHVEPRPGIIEATRTQLERERITGKLIHLCFTCDPYPTGYDTSATREIIKLLKEYGNHVQILTKGDGTRDFDLLDGNDWFGVTMDGSSFEPKNMPFATQLMWAKEKGINTWISFEPTVNPGYSLICMLGMASVTDKYKIGKMNYFNLHTDWGEYGRRAEKLCQELGIDYYIKDSLRAEMEKKDAEDRR
ncbi:MAG: hypothetical protein IJ523_10450 [Succinivibrionaceae bacterium]|nr:hypothetical protein [Succinivibrionaceae bacterium]